MLFNFFKTAYRNLLQHKLYTILNISGLTLGITSCLIIFLLIKFELSFDNFHSKKDRIYRIVTESYREGNTYYHAFTPFPMAEAVRNDFPELEAVTQSYHNFGGMALLENQDVFTVETILFADHEFLDVFDFELLEGNRLDVLTGPNKVVLTASLAKTMFGNEPAVGKILKLNSKLTLQVSGIVADPPDNSHQPFSLLVSYDSFTNDYFELEADIESWDLTDNGATYVVIPENINPQDFEKMLEGFGQKYKGEDFLEGQRYFLQSLEEIHFDERFAENNFGRTTSKPILWGFIGIGMILLIAACINFVNLSTAQSVTRAKEIGIRKVMGAIRGQLIAQFLSEVLVISTLATILSITLAEALLPMVNTLIDTSLQLDIFSDMSVLIFLVSTVMVVTLFAGTYPSFVLTKFQPAAVLRNKLGSSKGGMTLRRFLVVTQFFIAQVLIIATIVVFRQIDFFHSKSLGFSTEHILNFGIGQVDSLKRVQFQKRLLQVPGIERVSFFSSPPSQNMHLNSAVFLPNIDPEEGRGSFFRSVDGDYLETYDIELIAGQDIDQEIGKAAPGVLVNENFLKDFGIRNPEEAIGETIEAYWFGGPSRIVGVIKDFHNRSLQNDITNVVLFYNSNYHWRGAIKLSGTNISESLSNIGSIYKYIFPENSFEYQFEDDRLAELYQHEERTYRAFQLFAIVAILICCLGLFGLVSFIAHQKIKEIGIRKVLGANVGHILALFSRQFTGSIFIAFLIAAPIGYLAMEDWLNDFAYRIDIDAWTFIITGALTIIVTGLTVSFHSIKSANANPVESLRNE